MTGYYRMQRGWQDHALFRNQPHSRRDAWAWLIEAACWRATDHDVKGRMVRLERGQLCASRHQLATAWEWTVSSVTRFLQRLQQEGMIELDSETGQSLITICNYDHYQGTQAQDEPAPDHSGKPRANRQRTSREQAIEQEELPANYEFRTVSDGSPTQSEQGDEARPDQNRTAKEERKNNIYSPLTPLAAGAEPGRTGAGDEGIGAGAPQILPGTGRGRATRSGVVEGVGDHAQPNAVGAPPQAPSTPRFASGPPPRTGEDLATPTSRYRFQGKVIRLIERDYLGWLAAYPALPDLDATLREIDALIVNEPERARKNWFCRVSASLGRRNREAMERAADQRLARPAQPRGDGARRRPAPERCRPRRG